MKKCKKVMIAFVLVLVNIFQLVAKAESLGKNEYENVENSTCIFEKAEFLQGDDFKAADPTDTYEDGLAYEKEVLEAYKVFTENNENKGYTLELCLEDFDVLYRNGNVSRAYQLNEEMYFNHLKRVNESLHENSEFENTDKSSGSGAYYYNIGTNLGTKPNYSNYNLIQMAQKGDVVFDTKGSHGIAGQAAIAQKK